MSDNSLSGGNRIAATAIIWTAFTILMIAILMSSPHFFTFILGVLILMVAARSTLAIWDGSIIDNKFEENQKRKNTDRNADTAALLLQLLNDDERNAVRQRLLNTSDGEIPEIFAETGSIQDYIDT